MVKGGRLMFEVRYKDKTLCISPTLKGAEHYMKLLIKRDLKIGIIPKYEIIEEVLEVL